MATKLDLRKELRHLYEPPAREVVAVEVPAMSFLMVNGAGDPRVVSTWPRGNAPYTGFEISS